MGLTPEFQRGSERSAKAGASAEAKRVLTCRRTNATRTRKACSRRTERNIRRPAFPAKRRTRVSRGRSAAPANSANSAQPGGEEALDVAATTWFFEAAGDCASFDDDECGHRVDLEVLEQVRTVLLGDAHELERPMVAPSLQDLREKALDTPAMPGQRRVKEDQPRLMLLQRG